LLAHYGFLVTVGAEEGLGQARRYCILKKANPVGTEKVAYSILIVYYSVLGREKR